MKLLTLSEVNSLGSERRTVLEWGKWWNNDIHRLEKVTLLNPQYSLPYITAGLGNIYNIGEGKNSLSANSREVRWRLKNNQIVQIPFTRGCNDSGDGGRHIKVYLKEKYYDKNDVFKLENDQKLFVVTRPIRISDNEYEYTVTLVGSETTRLIDTTATQIGKNTRYMYSLFPELSDSGSTRFYFNVEEHVNWISLVRKSVSYSSDYAMQEKFYATKLEGKDVVVKMEPARQHVMNELMYAMANVMIFGEATFDANLQNTLFDNNNNFPIMAGDGVLTSINKYADVFEYSNNVLSLNVLQNMFFSLSNKSKDMVNNHYTFIVNKKLWDDFNRLMTNTTLNSAFSLMTDGFFINKSKQKIDLKRMSKETQSVEDGYEFGANFDTYRFAGNRVTFAVDRILTDHYPNSGFGFCIDTGIDEETQYPNVMALKYQGTDIISGDLPGLGGMDGKTSGMIATPVDGSSIEMKAYTGAIVINPYKAAIIQEAIY